MSLQIGNINSNGLLASNATVEVARDPNNSDVSFSIGQVWINTQAQTVFTLVGFNVGVPVWQATGGGGGGGSFSSLTVTPGPTSLTGVTHITGNVDTPGVITLDATGGTTSTVVIANSAGTSTSAIDIHAGAGGINVVSDVATGTAINISASASTDADSIEIVSSDGGVSITAEGNLNLAAGGTVNMGTTTSVTGQFRVNGDIDEANVILLSANGGPSETITIESVQGTGNTAILMKTFEGGITVQSAGIGQALSLSSAGPVFIGSLENTSPSMTISSDGGVDNTMRIVNPTGTNDSSTISSASISIISDLGGIGISAQKDFELQALQSSSIAVIGAAQDLTLSASNGSINVFGTEGVSDAIVIDATGAGGGIKIAPSDSVVSVQISNISPIVSRTTTINGGIADAALTDLVSIADGGVSTSASAEKEVTIATGATAVGVTLVSIATGNLSAAGNTTLNLGSGNAPSGTTQLIKIGNGTGGGTKSIQLGNATDSLTTVTASGVVDINSGTETGATSIGNSTAGGVVTIKSDTSVGINTTGTAATTIGSATGGTIIAESNTASGVAIQLNANNAAGGITATVGTGELNVIGGNIVMATAATGLVLTPAPATTVSFLAGAGDPNGSVTAGQGSIYLRTDGNSTSTRAYINSDAGTTWVAVTTAS